jgi:hypothetical protein
MLGGKAQAALWRGLQILRRSRAVLAGWMIGPIHDQRARDRHDRHRPEGGTRLPVDLAAVLMLAVYAAGVWAVHSAS